MTKDPYWDELGIAWIAVEPGIDIIVPLESHLRRRSRLIGLVLAVSAVACVAGLLLGTATIWLGIAGGTWNFVTRGVAVLVIAVLAGIATAALAGTRAGHDARAVSETLAISIRQARRLLLTIDLALAACLATAVLGLVGAAIRTQLSGPPKLSPVIDLALLALVAVALGLMRRRAKTSLGKLEYLQRTLAAGAPE